MPARRLPRGRGSHCPARLPRGATFAVRLRAFCLAAGLVQRELSRKAGVCEPTIRSCEEGRHRPRAANLIRLARALGVPPAALEPGGSVPRELRRAE